MIKIEAADKVFSLGGELIYALKDVNLQIKKGEFVIMLGSNGSGKTTLLNCLAGSLKLNSGKIIIRNNDVTSLPEHRRSKWISRVFQDPLSGTASDLTILENFRLAALRTKPKMLRIGIDEEFRKRVRDSVATLNLGLENKLNIRAGSLSGGQRQALTLLMAVMDESEILLLDEPAAALDPSTAEVIMQLAEKVIRENNLTAILVTHNLKHAIAYGDRIILMREGKVAEDFKKTEKKITIETLVDWY
jgi:putative tryptophan/tyrosine transport system ATP-binding protein